MENQRKMLYRIISVLIILNCFSTIQTVKRSVRMKLSSAACKAISEPAKRFDCNFNRLNGNSYGVNGYIEFNRDLAKNAEVQFQLHFKTSKGTKVVKLLDLQLNLCDVLNHSTPIPLIKELLNEAFRTSNIPYNCPFKGNFVYNVTNYILTDATLPKYISNIFFNVSVNFFENKKLFATVLFQGSTIMS